jgi:hypothetical protein
MNTQTNNERNTISVVEDDAFSYDGYQVVRGEFFAHTYEPSFTFNSNKVSVNTACIKKLPDTDFVQILVNPDEKKLAVRPCQIPSGGVPQHQNGHQGRSHAVSFLQKSYPLWDGIQHTVISCSANL